MSERGKVMEAERRRRTDANTGARNRLAVDEAKLDRDAYTYRWVNDVGDRIAQLTRHDDWDIVPDRAGDVSKNDASQGAEVSVRTGGVSGPMRSVLVRKPIEYHKADVAAQQRQIDEKEAGLKQSPAGNELYVPGGRKAPMNVQG